MFEYDENKSQSNLIKHGIDFVEAQKLWDDPNLLEIPARTQDEQRSLVLAKIDDKHWSAINHRSLPKHSDYLRPQISYRRG